MEEADARENDLLRHCIPAIFGRLGPKALRPLKDVLRDEESEASLRDVAMMSMAAVALRHPEHADEVFLLIASVAADPGEDGDLRACAGCVLLDCARREHQDLILALVRSGPAEGWYSEDEAREDLRNQNPSPYQEDWMDFYSTASAESRRRETEAERLSEKAALKEALGRDWGEDPDACPDAEEPEEAGPGSQRRPWLAMEKISARFRRVIGDKNFKSVEEANAYLKTLNGEIPAAPAANAWERAQDLMYDAWQERSERKRLEMAREALEICADCGDAYSLLAEETARTPAEAAVLYRKAVAAEERTLGPDFFRENVGQFWSQVQTRPYMRARADLARCLWTMGDHDAAVRHYYELLRLSPRDGQRLRGALLAGLGDLGRFEEIEEILARPEYQDDDGLEWSLMKALTAFLREGASSRAGLLLKKSLERNKHVPDYLLGRKNSSWSGGRTISAGGEDEASFYAFNFLSVWKRVPNALAWVATATGEADSAQVGRNVPCPCGSGKKFKKCCLNREPEGHA
ncbi:MAG: hypothetical protein HKL90_04885 [Elusimicrobia bacterium]|nr:hypothetical protein [Elusimicrobiota bacterium]